MRGDTPDYEQEQAVGKARKRQAKVTDLAAYRQAHRWAEHRRGRRRSVRGGRGACRPRRGGDAGRRRAGPWFWMGVLFVAAVLAAVVVRLTGR